MHKLKIRRIGNSLGTILPRDLLNRLQLSEGDDVFLFEDQGGVRLTPYDPDFDTALEAFEAGRKRYRNALRKLAE